MWPADLALSRRPWQPKVAGSMIAMQLSQPAPIEHMPLVCAEVPDPSPGPGQVRVEVRCCGVCRTDLHVIEGDLPVQKTPLIPGHQIVGVVDRLGSDCKKSSSGGCGWVSDGLGIPAVSAATAPATGRICAPHRCTPATMPMAGIPSMLTRSSM
jgi:NADPH:quinone reductase-like Zn-dependent oxidoreductase